VKDQPVEKKYDPLWDSGGASFPGRDALIVQSRGHQDEAPGWWRRLMCWVPSDRQIESIADWLLWAGRVSDRILKTAVIFACLYILFDIVTAFLPGGPASHLAGR
jgi:hypothetical protein